MVAYVKGTYICRHLEVLHDSGREVPALGNIDKPIDSVALPLENNENFPLKNWEERHRRRARPFERLAICLHVIRRIK